MRVVVVGATGNTGTTTLRALAATPEVTSVLGIARRMPDTDAMPYSLCEWSAIDIAAASEEEEAVARLREAFGDAEAVIHLAWLVQPNSQRDLLRRVNVEGTARVARAAAEAGVKHLIAASSVGAYSPDPEQSRRDESWPVQGVQTSHYSVDKAAQERLLDEFAASHPEMVVTRLRPALVFQADAASEVQRYFLGERMPVQALGSGALPTLPLPKGLRGVQAVHADDLGRAYAAAVLKRAPGAFNICADDVLGPQDLADILDHGRYLELPTRVVRAFLSGGHKTGLVAANAGWVDLAVSAPLMDNGRAKAELGWEPKRSAAEALRELVEGLVEGRGASSVPLRPRSIEPLDETGAAGHEVPSEAGYVSENLDSELLELYLSDHLTGATAGVERFERMSEAYIDTPVYARLSELTQEVRWERAFLNELIDDLGLRQRSYRQAVAWAGERLGRLKSNGRLLTRSPLSLLIESELMRSAVVGKLGLWQTLATNAEDLNLDAQLFEDLSDGARRQLASLDEVHLYARSHALRSGYELSGGAEASEKSPADAAAMADTAGFEKTPTDIAEKPGTDEVSREHADALADEWGEESFPASDPPAHY
ncbi:NAD-dependent epimerase/dehydratase family protein [Leucobacter sp. GX24907]